MQRTVYAFKAMSEMRERERKRDREIGWRDNELARMCENFETKNNGAEQNSLVPMANDVCIRKCIKRSASFIV